MADSEVAIANLGLLKIGHTKDLLATFDDGSLEADVAKLEYPQSRDELFAEFKWPRATRHAYLSQLGGDDWDDATAYAKGDYVSYAPAAENVVNMPETATSFVYVSLQAANTGNQPDTSPTFWAQVSRAGWAFVFLLPADVIEVHGLYRYGRNPREENKVPFELGNDVNIGTVLYTDTGLPWLQDWDASAPASVELVYTGQVTDPKQFPPLFTAALYWDLAVKFASEVRKDPELAARMQIKATAAKGQARAAALRERQKDPPPTPSHIIARRGRSGTTR